MNDTKNILLAWISSISTVFAAIEYRDMIAILSAVVLPVVFFTLGKAVDVAVQIYLDKKAETRPVGSVLIKSQKNLNADLADEADQDGSKRSSE